MDLEIMPDEQLIRRDYWRAAMYADLAKTLGGANPMGRGLEVGGSNHVIQQMCPRVKWEERDYPPWDAHDPKTWQPPMDIVVTDQILEHTERPWDVLSLMAMATKKTLVVTVPFLIGVHPCPTDFWRITPDALGGLLGHWFKRVEVRSWGNALVNYYFALYGTTGKLLDAVPYSVAVEALRQNDPANPFMVWAVASK